MSFYILLNFLKIFVDLFDTLFERRVPDSLLFDARNNQVENILKIKDVPAPFTLNQPSDSNVICYYLPKEQKPVKSFLHRENMDRIVTIIMFVVMIMVILLMFVIRNTELLQNIFDIHTENDVEQLDE